MCQTIEESVPQQHAESSKLPPAQEPQEPCPLDCPCRSQKTPSVSLQLVFNAMGLLFAVFATYMMITTDSNLYLIFWICYSVLRRMMGKSRPLKMKQE